MRYLSSTFTIKSAYKSENLDSISKAYFNKEKLLSEYMEAKTDTPDLIQKQIAKQMVILGEVGFTW